MGFDVYHEATKGKFHFIVINTCGFINDAKEESIDLILHYAEEKKQKNIEKIVVFGCLSQRYKEDLKKEIPEVDAWFGKFELKAMLEYFKADYQCHLNPSRVFNHTGDIMLI